MTITRHVLTDYENCFALYILVHTHDRTTTHATPHRSCRLEGVGRGTLSSVGDVIGGRSSMEIRGVPGGLGSKGSSSFIPPLRPSSTAGCKKDIPVGCCCYFPEIELSPQGRQTTLGLFFATSSCFDSDFSSLSETLTLAKGLSLNKPKPHSSPCVRVSEIVFCIGTSFGKYWNVADQCGL